MLGKILISTVALATAVQALSYTVREDIW